MKTSKKLIISIVIKSQSIGDRVIRDERCDLEEVCLLRTIQPLASDPFEESRQSQMYFTLSSDNIKEIEPPPGFRVNIKY